MSYIKLRHNTWYARLGIPAGARPILGRNEFVKSLQTSSKAVAQSRAVAYIAEWKEAIAHALSLDPIKQEALWWWKAYSNADSKEQINDILHVVLDRAELLESRKGLKEAQDFYDLATGKAVELSDYVESWHQKRLNEVSEHFADTSRNRVKRMVERYKLSTNVTRKAVESWIDEQRGELAVTTVRKIIKACNDFWSYLQKRELVPEGASPFDEHEIKPKPKESLYKDMQPYTVNEVIKLHKEAVNRGKENLATAIRIGAYTGFRLDEICKLQIEDVVVEDGIKCLRLRESKTKAGFRTIPIADKLLPLVNQLCSAAAENGDLYLIPNEKISRYGKRCTKISKQFSALKTDMGFGETHDFHSFRRTVATLLEKGRVEELHAARLLGHKLKTMSYGLYSGGAAMGVLKEAIDVIDYGDCF